MLSEDLSPLLKMKLGTSVIRRSAPFLHFSGMTLTAACVLVVVLVNFLHAMKESTLSHFKRRLDMCQLRLKYFKTP